MEKEECLEVFHLPIAVFSSLLLLSILGFREVCAPTRGCCNSERAAPHWPKGWEIILLYSKRNSEDGEGPLPGLERFTFHF